jgi:hypothetical protein
VSGTKGRKSPPPPQTIPPSPACSFPSSFVDSTHSKTFQLPSLLLTSASCFLSHWGCCHVNTIQKAHSRTFQRMKRPHANGNTPTCHQLHTITKATCQPVTNTHHDKPRGRPVTHTYHYKPACQPAIKCTPTPNKLPTCHQHTRSHANLPPAHMMTTPPPPCQPVTHTHHNKPAGEFATSTHQDNNKANCHHHTPTSKTTNIPSAGLISANLAYELYVNQLLPGTLRLRLNQWTSATGC